MAVSLCCFSLLSMHLGSSRSVFISSLFEFEFELKPENTLYS